MEKDIGLDRTSFERLLKSRQTNVEETRNSALAILARLPKKPDLVVDIGAGYGELAINFGLLGNRVIAIEPENDQRKGINFFLKKYPKAKRVSVIEGVAEKMPLESNMADLCILSQVLEHVNNLDKTMSEVFRILKPGGYLYLSSPNYLYPFEQHLHIPYFPMMDKFLFSKWATFMLDSKTSDVSSFIYSINYTTNQMILDLCRKYKLKKIWSASDDSRNLFFQIRRHWRQNPTLMQILPIFISLPIKIVRSLLGTIGILPMKLEYLTQKVPRKLKKLKIK